MIRLVVWAKFVIYLVDLVVMDLFMRFFYCKEGNFGYWDYMLVV